MKIPTLLLMLFTGYLYLLADESPLLSDYIETALKANTQILSAQLASNASEQEIRQTGVLPDPAFMIEGRGIPLDISHFNETRELMFMLEQIFPAHGVLKRKKQREQFTSDIQNEMVRAVQNDIRRQVKQSYYRISYLDRATAVNRTHVQLLDEFEKIAESKYIVGKTGQQDLYQVKIEKARLFSELLSLKEKRASLAAELNRLLNRDLSQAVQTDSSPRKRDRFDPATLDILLNSSNPFLRAARLRIAGSEESIKLARASGRPAFKVMGGYMVMQNMDKTLMGRVGITLPFTPWSSRDTRAALEKSQLLKNKLEIDYRTLKDQLSVKVVQASNILEKLENQIELYEAQILPAAEQTVKLSVIGYQADRVDFLSLVQYAREQLDHKLRREELDSLFRQQVAQLEYVLGTSWDEVTK